MASRQASRVIYALGEVARSRIAGGTVDGVIHAPAETGQWYDRPCFSCRCAGLWKLRLVYQHLGEVAYLHTCRGSGPATTVLDALVGVFTPAEEERGGGTAFSFLLADSRVCGGAASLESTLRIGAAYARTRAGKPRILGIGVV